MFSPTPPLFSGWNWTPYTLSRATAAVRRAPYSAEAMTLSAHSAPQKEWTK